MSFRNTLVAFILIISIQPAKCQEIDSLKELLPGKENSERVDILYELSFAYMDVNDPSSAGKYGLEGFELSRKIQDSSGIVKMGRVMAYALRGLNKLDSSITIMNFVLPIAEKRNDSLDVFYIYHGSGIAYTLKAEYDKALSYLFRSVNSKAIVYDTASYIMEVHNIGIVYYKLEDYQKALKYFQDCEELNRKTKHKFDPSLLAANIALCYAYLKKFQQAEQYVQKGLDLCGNKCSNHRIMEAYLAKGLIYFGLKNYKRAEDNVLKSYLQSKKLEDIRFQLDNICLLSDIYLQQNRLKQARFYLKEAEKLIEHDSTFSLEMVKVYFRFSQLYIKAKKFKEASHYQLKYSALKASVYSADLTNNLMKTEAEHLERENHDRIISQNEIILLKEKIISRQSKLNVVASLLGLFLSGFIVLLLRNYQQKKSLNRELDKKIEARTLELKLSRDELLHACIERDLLINHASDDIRETVNTIKGLCSTGTKETSDPVAHAYLHKIQITAYHLVGDLTLRFRQRINVSL